VKTKEDDVDDGKREKGGREELMKNRRLNFKDFLCRC